MTQEAEPRMNSRNAPRPVRRAFLTAALMALAVIFCSCRPQFSKDDPLLKKPVEQLTDQEIARMVAVVKTNYGSFKFELHPEWAPQACRAFVKLAENGFYYGLNFFEVRPRAWIATGDPTGNGEGGPGFNVEVEKSKGHNLRGAVGLYYPSTPIPRPDLAGSQFYILVSNQRWMDGKYSVFGKVIDGMSAVDRIDSVPVTPRAGAPRPFTPLSPVIIQDLHLEVKK
jgi:peptidyl-prolyl cis-trans isomerase B (cyclophilin B)